MWENRWSESKLGCHLDQLISRIQDCITDLKTWMIHNKLQLNDDKTELMLTTPKKFHIYPSLPPSMQINRVNICFSPSVHSLGVILDQTLSFKQHVLSSCTVSYLELRRISTIRHYLSVDAAKTLICSLKTRLLWFFSCWNPKVPARQTPPKFRITLHVLSANLQSIPLFFAHCTGFPPPRE